VDRVGETTAAASERARAKINLALHIGRRRADGYHAIASLVVFAEVADTVTAARTRDGAIELVVRGPFARALKRTDAADNLAVRAAEALTAAAGRRRPATRLTLAKRLPVAAGLGGGSADAAAVLRLLDRQWRLGLAPDRLARVGRSLGADVPMCLPSRPLVATGIGERVAPVAGMPRLAMVLACPPVSVSTAKVFAALTEEARPALPPLPPLPRAFAGPVDLALWLKRTRNDLAEPASVVSRSARIAETALARDPECLFARMSGSGAAAFGIFPSTAAARRAAARLRQARPNWWVAPTWTGGS